MSSSAPEWGREAVPHNGPRVLEGEIRQLRSICPRKRKQSVTAWPLKHERSTGEDFCSAEAALPFLHRGQLHQQCCEKWTLVNDETQAKMARMAAAAAWGLGKQQP